MRPVNVLYGLNVRPLLKSKRYDVDYEGLMNPHSEFFSIVLTLSYIHKKTASGADQSSPWNISNRQMIMGGG